VWIAIQALSQSWHQVSVTYLLLLQKPVFALIPYTSDPFVEYQEVADLIFGSKLMFTTNERRDLLHGAILAALEGAEGAEPVMSASTTTTWINNGTLPSLDYGITAREGLARTAFIAVSRCHLKFDTGCHS